MPGSIGPGELIIVLVIALIILGPKRLPEVGRSVGKGLREFRKASNDLRNELDLSLDEEPDAPAAQAAPATPAPPPPAEDAAPE